MSRFTSLASLCTLASLFAASLAAAPAGQPTEFQITSPSTSEKFCLGAASDDNGARADILPCDYTFPGQYQWSVSKGGATSGSGPSTQIKIFGGKCLDVTNGLNQNGNLLQVWDCDASATNPNQLFQVNGDGSIKWAGSTKCVDVTNGVFDDFAQVQIWDCVSGSTNQDFTPVAVPNLPGEHINWTNGPGCIAANSSTNGAAVTIQDCGFNSTTGTITWALPASGEGSITAFNGTKCLDVTNGVVADGTKLQVWDCASGNTNQHWIATRTSQNEVIQLAGTNFCVDLTSGSSTPGNPIQIWSCVAGSSNQQWTYVPDF